MSIREIRVSEEFRKCQNCGYDRGFHSSFLEHTKGYKVILICPECGAMYDIGWQIDLWGS